MNLNQLTTPSCAELLCAFRDQRTTAAAAAAADADTLVFAGVGDCDVYNITAPFTWNGCEYLLGRVEPRDTELSSVMFFSNPYGVWTPVEGAPVFRHMQDPCVTFIDGELVFGGVNYPVVLADGTTVWRMTFYRGTSFRTLRLFLTGPDKMKDIRLAQLPNGRIAVFTRPQGERGGRGRIGFFVAPNIDSIDPEMIAEAPLFRSFFLDEEWGGANEVHVLENGLLGVLGHIAYFDALGDRHYYPMVFCVNPENGMASSPRIIADRRDFPAGPAKRPDLVDVIFSGGLVRKSNGMATLYAGLSDAEAAKLDLPDPFTSFEERSALVSLCLDSMLSA